MSLATATTATLAVELAEALVEAGLVLHDCAATSAGVAEDGGVCLTSTTPGLPR